jgi:hypothetical protein
MEVAYRLRNCPRYVALGVSGRKQQHRHNHYMPNILPRQPRDSLGNRRLDKLQVTGLDRNPWEPFPYQFGQLQKLALARHASRAVTDE